MVEAISKTMNRQTSCMRESVVPGSLNILRRKVELREITNANMKLLHRLENTKSEYSVSKLEHDYSKMLKYSLNSSYSLRKRCEALAREVK